MAAGDQGPLLFGQLAGRIQPTGWTAPDGSWVILIGSEDPDKEDDIEIGDTGGFEQSVDLTSTKLLTWAMKLRNSDDAATVDFKASLTIGGVEFWSEQIAASEIRDYAKRTVNTYGVAGAQTVALLLEAVTP
ncbi:hypothetical protein LCGC14_0258630 [marine sediment metagenome]|uniref:Uncharacterized protein n=1 Tax=marine sediment metagenome TaxID=412755 RepID=A0A0F9X759_9ZZZZ